MIFSCYQYCFSFWFRCFRLSWFPTLFTGGHLKKRVRKHSHTYSWSAWNLVTSSTYRGRPPTWESPSMWKTTSGWQCSSGSLNAFLNHIFSAGLSILAVCGSLKDRLRKSTYSIWGTSSEGAYSLIMSSVRSLSSVTDSSLIVSGTAASGRNPTRRICSGRRGNQMLIRRKKCQLHFCSGTAVTTTCWTRPTIIPLPGEHSPLQQGETASVSNILCTPIFMWSSNW